MNACLSRRTARRWLMCLGIACLAALSGNVASAQEFRTWTDSTGKFKIEGSLEGVSGGKATLKRKDGSLVEIELKKLSAADQKFIADQPANPFTPVEDNPFKPRAAAVDMPPESKPSAAADQEAETATPDWSASEAIPLAPAENVWKLAVPIARPEGAPLKARTIPLPQKSNFWEGIKGLVSSASGERALIGYAVDEPKPIGQTRIVLCDLVKGKTLVTASTPGKMAPLALHDKGAQVLMRRDEWGWGNQDRLELWNLSPTGITKVLQWIPYDDQKGGERDVKWAAFIDEERLATLGGNGKLVVWHAPSAQPLYHLQVDGGSQPALSPDRKYLAFATNKQVGILDLNAKEVVALQATEQTAWPKLCFSPDATRLACLAHGKLLVWNTANGELFREIPLTGLNVGGGEMIWPHEKYLLMGKSRLFDIENQVPLWTYRGHEMVEPIGDLCGFVVSAGHERPGALVLATVPAPSFETALDKAMAAPDFFALKPGVTVRLNLDGLPDAAERENVRSILTKKLKDRGFEVGNQGTIELVATAEAGEEREVSYHGFGVSPWKNYKVREYISRLAFIYQGKSCWQTQGNNVPGFIQLKEGETIEQVLRRSERPSYKFFEHVELPKMLMKPINAEGLGKSEVSTAGIQ